MQTMIDPLSLANLRRAEIRADPYPLYAKLRASAPVHWDAPLNCWVVTRHADIIALLNDPRLSSQRFDNWPIFRNSQDHPTIGPLHDLIRHMMVYRDPPAHTRVRGLVARVFTPRFVEGLRGRISDTIDALFDPLAQTGRMDVIADLAYPLTTITIALLLGVPEPYWQQLKDWEDELATFLGTVDHTEAEIRAAGDSLKDYTAYFRTLVDERKRAPGDDLLTGLIQVSEAGEGLSEIELFSMCQLLMMAGHAAATHAVGNGILSLVNNYEQFEVLKSQPSLARSAAAELIRYDSSAQLAERVALSEIVLRGQRIAPGQVVRMVLGSANRDPDHHPDPDRLDVTRSERRLAIFGGGPHTCIGGPLALLQFELVLDKLIRSTSELWLDDPELVWLETHTLRGVRTLHVGFTLAGACRYRPELEARSSQNPTWQAEHVRN
jgi:hypothetical protein